MLKVGVCLLFAAVAAGQNQDVRDLYQSGISEYRDGHYREAESLWRAALNDARRDDARRAQILNHLGDLLLKEERISESEQVLTDALRLSRQIKDTANTTLALGELAALCSLRGRPEDAMAFLKQALKTTKGDPNASAALIGQIRNTTGIVYFSQGRYGKALKLFSQALEIARVRDPLEVPSILNNLGATAQRLKKFARAEELLNESLRLMEARYGPRHPSLTITLNALASLHTATGRYADALALYTRSLSILEQSALEFDARIARVQLGFAETYLSEGNTAAAADSLGRAASIARHNLSRADMFVILETYARFLESAGKPEEARDLLAEAKRARVADAATIRAYIK